MAISLNQINLVLSGGSNNSNPQSSLGGNPSSFPILGGLNNLFSNLTTEEAESGKTDYRCFYIFNDSETDPFLDVSVYIYSQKIRGSTVQIGIAQETDVQKIEIIGSVDSGNLILKYEQQEINIDWGSSISDFADNLVDGFSSIDIDGIEVSFSVSGSTSLITIEFKGTSNNRNHEKIELFENNLIGPDVPVVTIKKVTEGQPINSIAPTLAVDTVPPSKVVFVETSNVSRLQIGNLNPGDGVPIWIKRTTLPNTDFEENDNFILKVTGRPF